MSKPTVIVTENNLSVFKDGQLYTANRDGNPRFNMLKSAVLKGDFELFISLLGETVSKCVEKFTEGRITVEDNNIYFNDVRVNNKLCDRIVEMMAKEMDATPLIKFLDKLMDNESYHVHQRLFDFISDNNMPITEDGDLLGYKYTQSDYGATHQNLDGSRNYYYVGTTAKMPRSEVDDDPKSSCSAGLHVGSLSYASYGSGMNKTIIVRVNPQDVVCIPDNEPNKMRCCEFYVVSDYVTHMPATVSDDGVTEKCTNKAVSVRDCKLYSHLKFDYKGEARSGLLTNRSDYLDSVEMVMTAQDKSAGLYRQFKLDLMENVTLVQGL